jgi:hypothetical protein
MSNYQTSMDGTSMDGTSMDSQPRSPRCRSVTRILSIPGLAILGLALPFCGAALAAAPTPTLDAIDQRIAALNANQPFRDYFRDVRALLDALNSAQIASSERYTRMLALTNQAWAKQFDASIRRDLLLTERRNIALFLLGARFDDVPDPATRARLRSQFADALLRFVRSLKQDRIAGYQPMPVYVNEPFQNEPDAKQRQARHERFLAQNQANYLSNVYQDALGNELRFIEPRVAEFLRTQYRAPADEKELQRMLQLLSG